MNEYDDSEKRDDEEPLELERNNIYDTLKEPEVYRVEPTTDEAEEIEETDDETNEDTYGGEVELVEDEHAEEPDEEDVQKPTVYDASGEEEEDVEVEVEEYADDEESDSYEEEVEDDVEDEALVLEEPELEEPAEYEPVPVPMAATPSAGVDVTPGASVTRLSDEIVRVKALPFGVLGMSLLVLVTLAGCALRVLLYMKEPALWLDEAMLALQVLARSYGDLLEPLDGSHSAPIGFLLASKLLISIIGTDELGLRAFPLGASIVGLLGTAVLARKTLPVVGAVLAVAILAISWPAIGYAAELKQYSSDLMAASILFVLGYGVLMQPSTRGRLIGFAITGAVLQWFSLPVLFILAGVGLTAGLDALIKGDTRKAGGLALVALVWAGSFAGNWFAALQHTAADDTLRSWHHDAYLMFPPDRPWPAALKWLGWTFMDIFENPVGFVLPGLGMVGFVSGIIVIGRKNLRWLVMLLMPFVVMLVASYLQRYPVYGRFAQFLVPALVIIVGAGLGEITRLMWTNGQRSLATVLVFLMFVQPIALATNELLKPGEPGIRPVVEYLAGNAEAGDSLYLQHFIGPEYAYHSEQHIGAKVESTYVGVSSRNDWSWYTKEIASLGGNARVWFALQEDDSHLSIGERKFFETELNRLGTQLDRQQWGGYWLYLYDLSGVEAVPLPKVEPEPSPAVEEMPAEPQPEPEADTSPNDDASSIDDVADDVEPAEIE